MMARIALAPLILAVALTFPGCDSPEYGRPRGGGHGGDGGNYVREEIAPPSKIDSTKDLRRIDHYGPGP
jgi:hypothetical protein